MDTLRCLLMEHSPLPPISLTATTTCCIVGNGPSALLVDGTVIDAHDEVVRFNDFHVRGFERHVGSKTTLWVTFGRGVLPGDAGVFPDRILFTQGGSWNPPYAPAQVYRIPHHVYQSARAHVQFVSGRSGKARIIPSSGLLVAWYLIEVLGLNCISVAGFDHFSKVASSHHHYWIKKPYIKPPEHDGDAEASIFADWVGKGRARYLSPASPIPAPSKPPVAKRPCPHTTVVLDEATEWVLPPMWRHANRGLSIRADAPGSATCTMNLPQACWVTIHANGFVNRSSEGAGAYLYQGGVLIACICPDDNHRQLAVIDGIASVQLSAGNCAMTLEFRFGGDGSYCHAHLSLTNDPVVEAHVPCTPCPPFAAPPSAPPAAPPSAPTSAPPHWGPPKWAELHHHQITGGPEDAAWLDTFVQSIPTCRSCQKHFVEILRDNPPDFTSQSTWYRWTVMIHNLVNTALGKPLWSQPELP